MSKDEFRIFSQTKRMSNSVCFVPKYKTRYDQKNSALIVIVNDWGGTIDIQVLKQGLNLESFFEAMMAILCYSTLAMAIVLATKDCFLGHEVITYFRDYCSNVDYTNNS